MKKKKNTPRNWRQFSVLAGILVLAIAGAFAWFVMKEFSTPDPMMAYADEQHAIHEQAYREARELWDAQELTNYRYTITFYNPGGECTTTFDVIDDLATMSETADIDCQPGRYPIEDWSIDGIMNHIEELLEEKPCGPNGCVCDGYIIPEVEYDENQGFPEYFIYDVTQNYSGGKTDCTEMGMGYEYITDAFIIDSIESLPDE